MPWSDEKKVKIAVNEICRALLPPRTDYPKCRNFNLRACSGACARAVAVLQRCRVIGVAKHGCQSSVEKVTTPGNKWHTQAHAGPGLGFRRLPG